MREERSAIFEIWRFTIGVIVVTASPPREHFQNGSNQDPFGVLICLQLPRQAMPICLGQRDNFLSLHSARKVYLQIDYILAELHARGDSWCKNRSGETARCCTFCSCCSTCEAFRRGLHLAFAPASENPPGTNRPPNGAGDLTSHRFRWRRIHPEMGSGLDCWRKVLTTTSLYSSTSCCAIAEHKSKVSDFVHIQHSTDCSQQPLVYLVSACRSAVVGIPCFRLTNHDPRMASRSCLHYRDRLFSFADRGVGVLRVTVPLNYCLSITSSEPQAEFIWIFGPFLLQALFLN